ncbi:MAG: carbohydrate-binding domain-containing protein [Lachnospiraceae bacterium]|nr:carbohydrate-binding domain-containing protein [Lachnospiraceae bacterium]
MNIEGEESGNGILNIHAENEGLGSELNLTINGGTINIDSVNDGINTN